ncbi:DUF4296 domain-containing protein [uncultured Winogradskyella sp.]|uniref:DUF4296 domain-containing protein n=1 Tax=uncultured Winogradskyella sp. TaxID=395353 RepID=UPI002604448C|nr:DUF4296 domain-containing protein [uncultured Winogradskyella sp.]
MLKNVVVILILFGLVIACDGSEQIKKPDNLISKKKMSNILYDLYIINAAKGVNRKLLEKNGFVPETYLLTKYDIDSIQFASSNSYYAFNTEVYQDIVEEVKARLEKEKETYEEIRKKETDSVKAQRDSIMEIGKKKKDSTKKAIDSLGFN